MAVTHKGQGELDRASEHLLALNRLSDGDYTLQESDELLLTVGEVAPTPGSVSSTNDGNYWIQIHPETGIVRIYQRCRPDRHPIDLVTINGPTIARIQTGYRDTGAEAVLECFVRPEHREINPLVEVAIITEGADDLSLLNLIQSYLASISNYMATGELPPGMIDLPF